MDTLVLPEEVTQRSREARAKGRRIGFVPTMGYLHEGHLSLVRAARTQTDLCVVSIYVNPTQFGPDEDLEAYPRHMGRDSLLLEKEGVDILFAPSDDAMYPGSDLTRVRVNRITEGLCGAFRPVHFEGVCTIVAKLFHVVEPDVAYFGQKDFQQAVVLRTMARDLLMPIEVRALPTVREEDGLAMSSRNAYLDEEERKAALSLLKALKRGKTLVEEGEKDPEKILLAVRRVLESEPLVGPTDYVEMVNPDTLETLTKPVTLPALLAIAAYVGRARLIDNLYLAKE